MIENKLIVRMMESNTKVVSCVNRNKFVQMKYGSNDQTKWLTELIDRSL